MTDDYIARAKRIMAEDLADVLEESEGTPEAIFDALARRCESPIEVLMLGALAFGINRSFYTEQAPSPGFVTRCVTEPTGIWIVPQFEIGRHRVDFLVTHIAEHMPNVITRAMVAVECDGHDYHDKTPEQAQRDKSRDRELIAQGYPVLRFTGREIVRDPRKCADDVANALIAVARHQFKAMVSADAELAI